MLSYLEPLAADFKNNANPANAVSMQAYLKDKFICFGIKTPLRKEIVSNFISTHGRPEYRDLKELVSTLFELPEREFHYAAIEFCCQTKSSWTKETSDLFESMAFQCQTL